MMESAIIPLYVRAMEARRSDGLFKDERTEALVRRIDYDFSRIQQARIDEETQVALVLRSREFDRLAREFLARQSEAVVVHIGCGLDSRFERVDNGKVEWYDLDLPQVIELRREYIGGDGVRYHLLAGSVLECAWLDTVSAQRQHSFLFLAEGVFMFLEEAQVKSVVLTLKEHFPGAELVFDAFSPFFVWANNRRVARTKIGALCHWGLKSGKVLENWGQGIRLLDAWFPFSCAEPRLGRARWVRRIPFLARAVGVFHYQL